jgi:MtN3 and saliva related transmembrane protein
MPGEEISTKIIGWCSSILIVLTLAKQVYDQWRSGESSGVSPWLYGGESVASLGFAIYSWKVQNWIFFVSNSAALLSALAGAIVMWRNKQRHID